MSTTNNTTQASQLYALASGTASSNPFVWKFLDRDPTPQDVNYPIQKFWLNTSTDSIWFLKNFITTNGIVTSNWIFVTTGGLLLQTLSDTANTVVFPSSSVGTPPNNIQLVGGTGINVVSDAANNLLTISTAGGGISIDSINVDASTPPGTDPVVPDVSGEITVTGGQVAAGTTSNVIRTDSLAINTYTIEIQRSSAQAVSTIGSNGVSHYDSTSFAVDANGFVTMVGGGGFTWTNVSGAFSALKNNGYFITATATGTLPASPSQGDTIKFFVDNASQVLTIDAPGTQLIRFGSLVSSAGGTATSTLQGDSVELVYRSANTCWEAVGGFTGIWVMA